MPKLRQLAIGGTTWAAACLLVGLVGTAGRVFAAEKPDLSAWGLEYRLEKLKEPRRNRAHILQVDMTAGKAEPVVVIAEDPDGDGPAEAALTNPLKLIRDEKVLAFVNTNPWTGLPDANGKKNTIWYAGKPVDIMGLAVSGSRTGSPAQEDTAAVWVDGGGRVRLGVPPEGARVVQGMAGFSQIVKDGTVTAARGGANHPRTAIGVDKTGRVLWLVVVDGRQKGYSEGMSCFELASFMLNTVGCRDAVNMDGGGSSIMGIMGAEGRIEVVNSPSGRYGNRRRIRPLPTILTVRKAEAPTLAPVDEGDAAKQRGVDR